MSAKAKISMLDLPGIIEGAKQTQASLMPIPSWFFTFTAVLSFFFCVSAGAKIQMLDLPGIIEGMK
jgi:ribosome-interacting GTPase 1